MTFSLKELEMIERLLSNRMNADFDPDVKELLHKVRKEINDRKHSFNQQMELDGQNGTNAFWN